MDVCDTLLSQKTSLIPDPFLIRNKRKSCLPFNKSRSGFRRIYGKQLPLISSKGGHRKKGISISCALYCFSDFYNKYFYTEDVSFH